MANEPKGTPERKPSGKAQVKTKTETQGSDVSKEEILQAYRSLISLEDEFNSLKSRLQTEEQEPTTEPRMETPQPPPRVEAPKAAVRDLSRLDYFQRLDLAKIRMGIRRRLWFIFSFAILFAALGSMGGVWLSQQHTATAILMHIDNTLPMDTQDLTATSYNVQTLAEMVTSPQQFEAVRAAMGMDLTNEQLRDMVDVVSSRTSSLMRITATATDPEQAMEVANALAQVTVHTSENRYYEHARNAHNYFSAEEQEARAELDRLNGEIAEFKSKARFVEMDLENQAVTDTAMTLQTQHRDAVIEYEELLVEYENLEREIGKLPDHVVRYEYDENPLKARVNHKELSLLEARTKYGPENPKVLLLEEEIRQLRRALSDSSFDTEREQVYEKNIVKEQLNMEALRLQGRLQAAQKKRSSLAAQLIDIDERFAEVPQVQQQYATLLRKSNTAQRQVDEMAEITRQAESAMERRASDVQVYELASAASMKFPLLAKTLPLFGLAFGAAVGLFFVLINEVTDRRLRTPGQIKKAYSIEHMMSIPTLSGMKKNPEEKMLFFTRTLSERIAKMANEKPFHTLVFTSSIQGEGKSTIAYHLASYYKRLGMNTLFVDFDPKKNQYLPDQGQRPLEDFLRGNASVEEVIAKGHFDVVKAGDDPQMKEILGSDRLHSLWVSALWDEFTSRYDMIIVEAPGVVDDIAAVNVAALGDLHLHVIGSSTVTKNYVDSSLDELERCGVRPSGLILNQVHPSYIEDPRIVSHQKRTGWRSMFSGR